MTDNDYLALKPGDKVKFTGIHGGQPMRLVTAGDPGEVVSAPRYIQSANRYEVAISTGPYNTVFVMESDSIDIDWSRQRIILNGQVLPQAPLISKGAPTPPTPTQYFTYELTIPNNKISPVKCECGAHAIGIKLHHPGHSAWCPGRITT